MRDHPVPDHDDLTTDADEVAAGFADDRQIRMRITSFRLDVIDPTQDLDAPEPNSYVDANRGAVLDDGTEALWQIAPSTHPNRYRQASSFTEAVEVAAEVVHDLMVIAQARAHAEETAKAAARLREEFDERLVEGRPGSAS